MNCKICSREFDNTKELSRHLIEEHSYTIAQVYEYFNYSFETGEATCLVCGTSFKMTKRQIDGFKKNPNKSIGCCTSCSKSIIMLTHGSPLAKEDIREKAKKTLFEHHGVDHPMKSKKIKEKVEVTNMKRYGVKNTFQVKEFQEKAEQTNLKRHGAKYPIGTEKIRAKVKDTIRELYKVDNVFAAEEIREQIRQTHLEKRGVDHPMKSEESRKKMRETNKERRGVEYPLQAADSVAKMKKTNVDRHGVTCSFQIPELVESNREKKEKTNLERYGVRYFCQHEKCYGATHMRISKINRKFQEFLNENNIESELEFIVGENGYDLKVGSTLVEINPTFTHNATVGPTFGKNTMDPKPVNYHLDKTNIAIENGFNCIHIFDWDDLSKVMNLLKDKTKLFARKCEVKEIDNKVAKAFLEEHHLQGSNRSTVYSYGLYYNDTLVEVMTFGNPRYNKNYDWELLRLCSHPDFSVIGGASKLLSYFEEQVKPISLLSYCDLSKFSGEVYEKLGFTLLSKSQPAKHWYNIKTKRHITDNLLRQRGFDQLHNTSFGKGTSNEQLMLEHGYVEVYDCGQLTFTKTFK